MEDLAFAPATGLAAAVRAGTVTSRELVELFLDRIERFNPALNAVVTVDLDGARRRAGGRDAETAAGRVRGPLHGVPITVKDAFATAGIRTTSGTKDRADHVPAVDAVAVARLVAAGAVVVGKTNVPEGITGQETGNALFGRTVNPWDGARSPGGSSGGAAAAVAAGLCGLELGSDSGGSVRQPAHCCGIYGHVPTQGLVPLRGHMPLVPPVEAGMQVDLMGAGPLARSAADLAVALDLLAGPDGDDGTGWRLELPPPRLPAAGLAGVRVAVWADDPDFPVASEVRACIEAAADALEGAGAAVDRTARPSFRLVDAERVAFALWVGSTSFETGEEELAELVTAAGRLAPDDDSLPARRLRAEVMRHHDWQRLDGERRRLARAWADLFERHDVVLCPVSPVTAPIHDPEPPLVHDLDRRLARTIDVDGHARPYLEQMTWNIVVGMAGLPATAAPVGPAASGLPVGVQVVGPRFADRTTITFAGRLGDVSGGYRAPPGFA